MVNESGKTVKSLPVPQHDALMKNPTTYFNE